MTLQEVLNWYREQQLIIKRTYVDLYESAFTAKQVLEANRWHENRLAALEREYSTKLKEAMA